MYEIKPWKQAALALSLLVPTQVKKTRHSIEINEALDEGGALNANYQTMERGIIAACILERNGLVYGKHFVWKTAGLDDVSFDFADAETRDRAKLMLRSMDVTVREYEPA